MVQVSVPTETPCGCFLLNSKSKYNSVLHIGEPPSEALQLFPRTMAGKPRKRALSRGWKFSSIMATFTPKETQLRLTSYALVNSSETTEFR